MFIVSIFVAKSMCQKISFMTFSCPAAQGCAFFWLKYFGSIVKKNLPSVVGWLKSWPWKWRRSLREVSSCAPSGRFAGARWAPEWAEPGSPRPPLQPRVLWWTVWTPSRAVVCTRKCPPWSPPGLKRWCWLWCGRLCCRLYTSSFGMKFAENQSPGRNKNMRYFRDYLI